MKAWDEKESKNPSVLSPVCVIDGDQGIRNSLFMLLGTLGLRTTTFSTAEEFLGRLSDEKPSVLITELALPGMSGFELKEALNRKGIEIPTIGLTSESGGKKRREADRLGFLELVEKPFVYWSVVDRVQRTLQGPRRTPSFWRWANDHPSHGPPFER